MTYAFEIDFLPVGDGEHCGDAIAMRWREGDTHRVLVYDGGTAEYGRKLAEHIGTYYGTDHIDYLVNSHPDNDHAAGLVHLVENLSVGEVWMHRPWEYSTQIRQYFHDGRMTDTSLRERLQKKMSAAYRLEHAALKRNIPVYEPFAGTTVGIFQVLSPGRTRYIHELVPAFEKTPQLKVESVLETAERITMEDQNSAWESEYLPSNVSTSAENESSAILYAHYDRRGYLLTGDAGVASLAAAADFAAAQGIQLPAQLTFVQIPHHGGRHNVSTEVLNRIVGCPVPETNRPTRMAFVSASKKAPKHPKRSVTNAFIRRGFQVAQTKGTRIRFRVGMPPREGYGALSYVPFAQEGDE
ncbi:ComEC/Rec2 family competence protein [Frateuria terrea]|uniref:Metal-dependent hydrolase, beta-lactamase superfamily II n=1 Tax=Frateuria terrea TaxID=529704 RepID=A0A1H6UF30_9GAMM|nr:MBL fold metallo-hydrolase [Frateuria terrea]SEI89284.1 Metal-dependent hydrolase, beta-lactamase superfamily II [Frateuria terrea]SFP37240.1 Metal-dependent hydrolase, beta-lactamase superfamily II [Frateuria terrea]